MRGRRSAFAVWAAAVGVLIPLSFAFWWVGGMAACGEEVGDTPPGSLGDRGCNALVQPVLPWIVISVIPLAMAVVLGVIALRRDNRRLLATAIALPFLLIVGGVFAFLAVF
jgi:hypothetical protein